jgi:putative membrane protein
VSAVFQHWSLDPFLIVVAVVVAVHARGLRRHLRAIRRSGRTVSPWIGQALIWWAGLVVLLVTVVSPVDYWSEVHLTAHVVQHILLAFVAPPLIVIGAPWVPLLLGLPHGVGHWYGTVLQRTRPGYPSSGQPVWRWATAVRAFCARPWTAVVAFNMAMVLWHIPGPFDLAASNLWVHVLLAHAAFFCLGVGLWLQVFGSYPFRPLLGPPARVLALIATNAVMVVIAMTMVMFTRTLYALYSGTGVTAQAADQQLAGAILWVCGEVTFLPAILFTVSRWLDEEPQSGREPQTAAGSAG